jgi:hypothetical protein
LAAIAAAVVAYVKRETWALPAYRKAREGTGKWGVTPWTSGNAGQEEAEAPVEAPAPTRRRPEAA